MRQRQASELWQHPGEGRLTPGTIRVQRVSISALSLPHSTWHNSKFLNLKVYHPSSLPKGITTVYPSKQWAISPKLPAAYESMKQFQWKPSTLFLVYMLEESPSWLRGVRQWSRVCQSICQWNPPWNVNAGALLHGVSIFWGIKAASCHRKPLVISQARNNDAWAHGNLKKRVRVIILKHL